MAETREFFFDELHREVGVKQNRESEPNETPEAFADKAIAQIEEQSFAFDREWIERVDALNKQTGMINDSVVTPGESRTFSQRVDVAMQNTLSSIVEKILNLPEEVQARAREAKKRIRDLVRIDPFEEGEVFDPEQELKKIKVLPHKERGSALTDYKKKLAYQKEGLAKIQEFLVGKLSDNPDAEVDGLLESTKGLREKYAVSKPQKKVVESILQKYKARHDKIKDVRDKYPNDAELYRALFGRSPKGKVKVVQGPLTFLFQSHNPEDYAYLAYSEALLEGRVISEEDVQAVTRSKGVSLETASIKGLEGAIIAQNWSLVGKGAYLKKDLEGTGRHEEEHAIKRLFNEEIESRELEQEFAASTSDEEKKRVLTRYLRNRRQEMDEHARSEILAHLKTDTMTPNRLRWSLTASREEGGSYDYFRYRREKMLAFISQILGKNNEKLGEEMLDQVFGVEYKKAVKEGINAYQRLREKGYTKGVINAVLLNGPLTEWKKTVNRLVGTAQ